MNPNAATKPIIGAFSHCIIEREAALAQMVDIGDKYYAVENRYTKQRNEAN